MKHYLITISVILLAITSSSNAKEDTLISKWKNLSASTQNLQYQFIVVEGLDTSSEKSVHEVALKKIEDALNELVEAGALVSKRIKINSPAKDDGAAFDKLYKSTESLQQEYGIFVASEMLDCGSRLRFKVFKPGDEVELHIRMPEKDLKMFLENAKKLNLYSGK